MKRPSFQFYPGDWSSNPNLRRCTFAERGVWLEVMCLMHDQEPYGVLRWPLKDIAQAVGCKTSDLMALVKKGVLKGADDSLVEPFIYTPRSGRRDGEPVTLIDTQHGPIWYSSRMVKDEYVRTIRGESSRFGADNDEAPKGAPKKTLKAAPKPPFGDGASSSSSSSTSFTSVTDVTDGAAVKSAQDLTREELWSAGKSLLMQAGVPVKQCGSFVGKLVKDYGDAVVLEAVRATVVARPADPVEYLKATCMRTAGQRQPINKQEALEQRNRQIADEWAAQGA